MTRKRRAPFASFTRGWICEREDVDANELRGPVRRAAALLQNAATARQAVVEYLRSVGCRDEELTGVAVNAVSWRGAVYRAIPLGSG